jgi:hypothetical protein
MGSWLRRGWHFHLCFMPPAHCTFSFQDQWAVTEKEKGQEEEGQEGPGNLGWQRTMW